MYLYFIIFINLIFLIYFTIWSIVLIVYYYPKTHRKFLENFLQPFPISEFPSFPNSLFPKMLYLSPFQKTPSRFSRNFLLPYPLSWFFTIFNRKLEKMYPWRSREPCSLPRAIWHFFGAVSKMSVNCCMYRISSIYLIWYIDMELRNVPYLLLL